MRLPRPLLYPGSKPPSLLLSVGALLLTTLVVRTLRRRKSRRAGVPSRDPITVGTWSTPRAQAAARCPR